MTKKLVLFLVVALSLLACNKQQEFAAPALQVSKTSIEVSASASQEQISVKSNCYWDVTILDAAEKKVSWVSCGSTRGQGDCDLVLTIAANVKTELRQAFVFISTPSSKDLTKVITITQAAGEKPAFVGYEFPVAEKIEIDSPDTRKFSNGYMEGNQCVFKGGLVVSRSDATKTVSFECPSHTQPASGDDADKSIHRSIRMDDFTQGESVLFAFPLKNQLYGDLRLMFGARAAGFTAAGWSFYWSKDNKNWKKIDIANAVTPGSDAVWNEVYFSIPQSEAVPAGDTLSFKFTADAPRSKTYVCISNSFCICPQVAQAGTLPAMDNDKMAYTNSFDDLLASKAAYVEIPCGWLRSATNSYASSFTSFNSQYKVPAEQSAIAAAQGCYERPGYLQCGYYDESLWTRMCCGTFTIKIGERLKQMGVSSTDAKLTFKACVMKDIRGYESLAKVTVSADDASSVMEGVENEKFKEFTVEFKNLTQASVIKIFSPRLTDEELAALGRGDKVQYLQDYRFFIDDLKVELTDIHERGGEANGSNENMDDNKYNW